MFTCFDTYLYRLHLDGGLPKISRQENLKYMVDAD